MARIEEKPCEMKIKNLFQNEMWFQNTCLCEEIYQDHMGLASLHFHNFIEISIVFSGHGIHRVWGEAAECKKGDVYIINTGVPHNYFAKDGENKPLVSNLIFVPKDLLEEELADSNSLRFCYGIFQNNHSYGHICLNAEQLKQVEEIYRSIEKESQNRENEWFELSRTEIIRMLIMLSRFMKHTKNRESDFQSLKSKKEGMVLEATKYVMEHYADDSMTLEKIAESLFVSKSYLSKLFLHVTGDHFAEYLKNVRMQKACELLKGTQLTNDRIVRCCGLKDLSSFYRLFKMCYGMTPRQYRVKNQQERKILDEK